MFEGKTGAENVDIGFLLVPDYSMMSFSAASEQRRAANRLTGRTLYRWHFLTPDGAPTYASNGIQIIPEASIGEIGPLDLIVVCAGLDAENFDDTQTFAWLRHRVRHGAELGAICTGTTILAQAGLLDGYVCTVHWENLSSLSERFPMLELTGQLFEIDRDRFTCSGGTAALDLVLHLIALQHGHDLATAVSEQYLHTHIRGANDPQRMELRERLRVSHPKLLTVLALMEDNLEEPMSRQDLAGAVSISTRHLERLFRNYVGQSVGRYYLNLRLKRARLLVLQTSMPIFEIAVACGFKTASHFSRAYRAYFETSPRAERAPAPIHADAANLA